MHFISIALLVLFGCSFANQPLTSFDRALFGSSLAVAETALDCRDGVRCKTHGECTREDGKPCRPGIESDCRQSEICKKEGRCSFQAGACVALKSEDCKKSDRCKESGMCHTRVLSCVPLSDSDCKESLACSKFQNCVLYEYKAASNSPVSYSCVRNKKTAIANESEKNCKTSGGRWMGETRGRGRITGCLLPTADRGKACKDSSDCESVCVNYKCYEWSDYRGCGIIEKGNVICVD